MSEENQGSHNNGDSFFTRKVWLSPLFYIYFVSVLIALGMLYIHRENMVNRSSIKPDLAIDSTFFKPISSTPPAPPSSSGGPAITITSLLTPTKSQVEHGEQLFKMDCAPCHGVDGKGDGPAAATLNPKPRDFYSATGWVNGRLLSQMFKTVSTGITGSAMVSFAASLSPSDRLAIIDYVRSSFGNFPQDSPAQLQDMVKTYHLATPAGSASNAPAPPIPVAEAMTQIEEGALQQAKEVEIAKDYLDENSSDDAARLFERVVIDKQRALTTLAATDAWSKSLSDFVTILTSDAVQNGFDPKVAQLNSQEWQELFDYLKGAFRKGILEIHD